MNKKLSEIIKELEDKKAIDNFYLHDNYYSGELELNIEFNNDLADKVLNNSKIKKIESCAFWE